MNIKYKKNPLWRIFALMWLFMAVMHLGVLVFILLRGSSIYSFFVIEPIAFIIIASILGTYYLRLPLITYIGMEKEGIALHRGVFRLRMLLKFNDLDYGTIIDNKLLIFLKNKKKVEINLELISIPERDELNTRLSDYININKGIV